MQAEEAEADVSSPVGTWVQQLGWIGSSAFSPRYSRPSVLFFLFIIIYSRSIKVVLSLRDKHKNLSHARR